MNHYMIVWHETDGNDCTVFDTIVRAKSEENAIKQLFAAWIRNCPNAEVEDHGLYYPCNCSEEDAEYCEGHGGTFIREVSTFKTRREAEAAKSIYHAEYFV